MSAYVERPRVQCALGGALTTLNALGRVVPIVHASPGCASATDAATSMGAGYWGTGSISGRATPSTNLVEREIVFGGESRLAEQIKSTLEVVDGDLFAVITGCMTDIIGDDVRAVVGEFRRQGVPIVVAETGGFKGCSAVGYELIWEALIEQYVERGLPKEAHTVNLLGAVPIQDVFWRGNLLELRRLLEALGLRVNTFLTPFDEITSLKRSSEASLTVVLSDVNGQRAAQRYQETHGIPFITEPLPIGPAATERFLRAVAEPLGVPKERVDQVLADEAAWYYAFSERFADLYNDQDFQRFAIVVGAAATAHAYTRFLADDLGWIPYATVITDVLDDTGKARVRERFNQLAPELRPHLLFEGDTTRIADRVLELVKNENDPYGTAVSPAFVLGSTLDRPLAAALKGGFHSVSFPVVNRVISDQGYSGFRGGLRLAAELLSSLVGNR